MPDDTRESGAGTAPAEDRMFTQEEVDRIVTERLRRERQRAMHEAEKTVRDEFERRIAELEAAREAGQAAAEELSRTQAALQAVGKRALIADRLLARHRSPDGARRPALPPAYVAQIDGEDETSVDAAIGAAEEQWLADLRAYARPPADIGRPSNPPSDAREAAPARVDPDLAERMRHGDPEAFKQYAATRGRQ